MQILIIGAGVAGLTLASLLRRRGENAVVIERATTFDRAGYMLGLYYLGSRVLHGLELFDQYLARSVPMNGYHICNGHGTLVHGYDFTELTQRCGPLQGISRAALIDLLRESLGDMPLRMGTTVRTLDQQGERVAITFSDGSTDEFDLVVAADGLHSDTREMILSEDEYTYHDTSWGGWVFWGDPDVAPRDLYTEYWGAGRFVGLYPTKDRLGVFLGGSLAAIDQRSLKAFAEDVHEHFKAAGHPVTLILEQIESADKPFFWNFCDCRTKRWRQGRVVLLGDAATGFLPTAGIGASMAMESAAVLDDELSRTNAAFVEGALDLFEKRRRRRAEAAQTESRRLGKMMFVDSLPLAWGRDQLVKFYSLEMLIKSIGTMMAEPI